MMKILVTGSNGFIGKNLCCTLRNIADGKDKSFNIDSDITLYEYDIDTHPDLLDKYCMDCDFVFNLAGVNRTLDKNEFMKGNCEFSSVLLGNLKKHKNTCPVMLSSSIQADTDSPYGISKRAGEDLFFEYEKQTGAKVLIYRFTNVFGKWCNPNYNSVVATFCNNIANDLPITINDRNTSMTLAYIDDVVTEMINALSGDENREGKYCRVSTEYKAALGEIADLIYEFKSSRNDLSIPNLSDEFTKKLYATYLSYIPSGDFSYPLKMNIDNRGSFTEIIRTEDKGQFSVNILRPYEKKGNHYHNTKNEKFIVVSGSGVVRFRKIGNDEVIEYFVCGDKIEVVDIPVGYTHNIENLSDTDMVTFMWCSECFDANKPDTYFEEV